MSGSSGSIGWPLVVIVIVVGSVGLVAVMRGLPIQMEVGPLGVKFITSPPLLSSPPSPAPSVTSNLVEESSTNSPLIQGAPTPTSSPTPTNTYKEKYAKGEYPMPECGKVISRPVYRIFIPRGSNIFESSSNFENVTKRFCQDAKDLDDKVRVASFSDEEEANMFLEFIKGHFNGAWKEQAP